MKNKLATVLLVGAAVSLHAQTASVSPAPASPAPDAWGLTPPAWLTASSVAVKEGYDSNLYGTSTNLAGHPDVANVSSWYNTISASLSVDLLAAAGAQNVPFLNAVALTYSADYTEYAAAAQEDNLRNTIGLTATGKSGPWSLSVDNQLIYVDGSEEDPFYNTFTPPGFSASLQRRNQIQERNASFLRYDASNWFVRAVDSATYYDMMIDEHDPIGAYKGYLNWVNRDDVNVGTDLGYKLTPDFAFTFGWRLGQQTQAHPYYNLTANDSTYNRLLGGFEGKPFSWLEASFVAGPDYRRYSDEKHLGLKGDQHTWFYTESSLTATLSPLDTITASNKVWHFVAAPGLTSDQETADSVLYKHAFDKELSASAGVRVAGFRFDAPTVRNDWATTYPVDLTYAFTRGLSLSADYSVTQGRSHLPEAAGPGRDWDENLASLLLKASF